jgi:poly-beta-1,6-N-acetyl-D-glucosamine biosynthesis protein PgaD
MVSGKALIDRSPFVASRPPQRQPVHHGVIAMLTGVFWAIWVYLALPLLSVLLWIFGARRFVQHVGRGSVEQFRDASITYSSVLLVMVGLLAAWILWNVLRYGGSKDRRTEKVREAPDEDLQRAFRIAPGVLDRLRGAHRARLDLDADGGVMILASSSVSGSRRSAIAGIAGREPRLETVGNDRADAFPTLVGEMEEVVKVG